MPFLKTKQRVDFTQSASVTVASTASETTLVGTGEGSLTIQKDSLAVGKTFRVTAFGYYSNTGTPTLNLKFKAGSTVLAETGAVTTATSASNRVFKFEAIVTIRSIGASGTALGQCDFADNASTIALTAQTSTATVDSTANNTLNLTATWGASSSSNTITCTNLVVEELN